MHMSKNKENNRVDLLLCCRLFSAALFLFFGRENAMAQYEDSPLKGERWATISGGPNSMDYLSWQGMGSLSIRGESVLTQVRIGYSQELIQPKLDSCSGRINRLTEIGLLWGDGWATNQWYATASIGFGLNMRMFCSHKLYEDKYITVMTIGVPTQIEFGVYINNKIGVNMVGVANWNFRAPYIGGHLGVFYRL